MRCVIWRASYPKSDGAWFRMRWRSDRRTSGSLRRVIRVLLRIGQVGWKRRMLLAEAAACLLIARLALIFIPFARLARSFGAFEPPAQAAPRAHVANAPEQARLAAEIGWAVTQAARYVPANAACLPQAMAARSMLKRRGVPSVVHFGAAKGQDRSFETHAWLDAAGVEVTGYRTAKNFAEIACFL